MPSNRTPITRRRKLSLDQRMSLMSGFGPWYGPPPFRTDAEWRRCWEQHRAELLAQCNGVRPAAWWDYDDAPIERPARECEAATLFEAGLLTGHERERLLQSWKMRFDDAWSPTFCLLDGDVWLDGEAARQAHFEWAGIPPRLVQEWTREREEKRPTT
jgi:hypothetical protein